MTVPGRWHLLWVNAMWRQINSLLSFAKARNKRSGSQLNEQNHCSARNEVSSIYSQPSKYTGRFQSSWNNFPLLFITCSALIIDKHSVVLLSVFFCSFSVIRRASIFWNRACLSGGILLKPCLATGQARVIIHMMTSSQSSNWDLNIHKWYVLQFLKNLRV